MSNVSRFGTFVRLPSKFELHEQLHLLMGPTEIKVHRIKISKNGGELVVKIPDDES